VSSIFPLHIPDFPFFPIKPRPCFYPSYDSELQVAERSNSA
jgi:hypothetical protein